MLAYAERKAGALRVRWVEGDFRSFELGGSFDLILACGHAFQALLTEADQRSFLRCARHHLNARGRLAFDTRNTVPLYLDVNGEERSWHSFVLPDGTQVDVSGVEVYDAASSIMHCRTFRTQRNSGLRTETALDIKFTAPDDLRHLLEDCGLQSERLLGDFSGGPLIAASPEIIVVARPKHAGQSGAAT